MFFEFIKMLCHIYMEDTPAITLPMSMEAPPTTIVQIGQSTANLRTYTVIPKTINESPITIRPTIKLSLKLIVKFSKCIYNGIKNTGV